MKIVMLIALMGLASCGREAIVPNIENYNSYGTKKPTIIPSTANQKASEGIRNATIIVAPEIQDLNDLDFRPLEGSTSSDWESLWSELPYANLLLNDFSRHIDIEKRILALNEIIIASGAYRDQAALDIFKLKKKLKVEEDSLRSFEVENKLEDIACYYSRRPRRGKPYNCSLTKTEEFRRSKKFYSCQEWKKFELIAGQETHENYSRFQLINQGCQELQEKVSVYSNKVKHLQSVRVSAESVVLDVLLETEKVTDLVFAAKASTIEKPDSIGEESIIRFNNDQTAVEELKLYIDFLPGNSTVTGYHEYSIENGKISDVKMTTSNYGVKKLSLKLELPDMTYYVNADISVAPMPTGMRIVDSAAKVVFKNGKERVGVFKLELDLE